MSVHSEGEPRSTLTSRVISVLQAHGGDDSRGFAGGKVLSKACCVARRMTLRKSRLRYDWMNQASVGAARGRETPLSCGGTW